MASEEVRERGDERPRESGRGPTAGGLRGREEVRVGSEAVGGLVAAGERAAVGGAGPGDLVEDAPGLRGPERSEVGVSFHGAEGRDRWPEGGRRPYTPAPPPSPMRIEADSVDEYLSHLEPARADAVGRILDTLRANLPPGFEETMQYGMPSFVVPLSRYPAGYHCAPGEEPLPFISVGNQVRHVGLYHSGLYADDALMAWFAEEWPKHVPTKLDAGKSCVRLKNMDRVPYALVAELAQKMTVDDWIARYEAARG